MVVPQISEKSLPAENIATILAWDVPFLEAGKKESLIPSALLCFISVYETQHI